MPDSIYFELHKSIRSQSDQWYENVQHLGTGGNAVTQLVLCTSGANKGVLFALKVFRRLSKPERRERFLSEVRFLQGCSHPSVMRVFDSGEFKTPDGNFPFVVAEYLPQRLYDVIRSNDATTGQKISYSLQLLSALRYIAGLAPRVVHRDIKPQNIFVKGRSCVLGDFGLMKLLDGKEEEDRLIFKESLEHGMPFFYRTPDLITYAKGEGGISPKSDVFQLGLVLAELFTGRNPAKRPNEVLEPFDMEPLGSIPGGLSGTIATLIYRMLEIDPDKRPDAEALLDPWRGAFSAAIDRSHALDGRVI